MKTKFSKNTKYYEGTVYEFNLPSGWSCPQALDCLVKVNRETGKMDNQSRAYRCYASSAERFPSCRASRWRNFDAVKSGIIPTIPKQARAVRIHASGDFFSQSYFDMWLELCRKHPNVEFWAFTKSISYWVNRLGSVPSNLILTASFGGKEDKLIALHNLKNAEVITDESQTRGRPIDTCDDQARVPHVNFCLMDNFKTKKTI